MPKVVLKLVPLLALGVMGYLVYSLLDVGSPPAAQGKEPPSIAKTVLRPPLVMAQDHASPAGRDPFEVAWASYLHFVRDGERPVAAPDKRANPAATPTASGATAKPPVTGAAAVTGSAATVAAPVGVDTAGGSDEPAVTLPPLPVAVTSVIPGDMAVIDGHVYRVGETLRGAAGTGWEVEIIDSETVVLKFANVRKMLPITRAGVHETAEKPAKPDKPEKEKKAEPKP
jgi:hypothetical protein